MYWFRKSGSPSLKKQVLRPCGEQLVKEPDYDVLMKYRLDILKENNLKLTDIQEVIGGLAPLEGAKDFLDALRAKTQVVILSDTFLQFATPLMRQLDWPTIFCHHLEVENDVVENYCLRQAGPET